MIKIILFPRRSAGAESCFYAIFLKLSCWWADEKLICARNRLRLLLQYLLTVSILSITRRGPQIRLLNLANKKYSLSLSLPNLSAYVIETVICCQNSRFYGVMKSPLKIVRNWKLLSCPPRVTVASCFVYKVIRDVESIDHLCINPIRGIGLIHKWSIDSH